MTALLILRRGGDVIGRCDAACYDAEQEPCTCVCDRENHGKGLDQAVINTRDLAEVWIARARADGRDIETYERHLDIQVPLFPLKEAS